MDINKFIESLEQCQARIEALRKNGKRGIPMGKERKHEHSIY
jgi:hypothetical protein